MLLMDHETERQQVAEAAEDYQRKLAEMVASKDELKARTLAAMIAGISENEASKLAGVTRKTVREWQGKNKSHPH